MPITRFVNLYGGPSVGKSTVAAGVSHILRAVHRVSCEYVSEVAKDLVWNDDRGTLRDQPLVWTMQRHRLLAPDGKVEVIVTDSPTVLSVVYDRQPEGPVRDRFHALVLADEMSRQARSEHWFIRRRVGFHEEGRIHSEAESTSLDEVIRRLLERFDLRHRLCDPDDAESIAAGIVATLRGPKRRGKTIPPTI